MLGQSGFERITFHGWTGYRTSRYTQGAMISADRP
jgi:hypothetical protein